MMTASTYRLIKEDTGSELVEFAICVPLLFFFIFGVVYFSFALYANHFVANAAKEAARYAVVRGSTWSGAPCNGNTGFNCTATSTDVTNYVIHTLPPGIAAANLSVATAWPGTTSTGDACDALNGANSPDCQVTVKVSYAFVFPLPFVHQGTLPLSATSAMSISE